MKRVYIAGPYSSGDIITILGNIRNGIKMAVRVLLCDGRFAPFCPWLDFLFDLVLEGDQKLTVENYYNYSMAWLDVSDVMLLMPGWKNSRGSLREYKRAKVLNLRIYEDVETLIRLE